MDGHRPAQIDHQVEKRFADQRVVAQVQDVAIDVRLRMVRCARAFDDHLAGAAYGRRSVDLLLDDMKRKIDRGAAASAGQHLSVDGEQRAGVSADIGELGVKVVDVVMADTAPTPGQQASAGEQEGAGAESDEGCRPLGRRRQIGRNLRLNRGVALQQAADDDEIVKVARFAVVPRTGDLHAAARAGRPGGRAEHRPAARRGRRAVRPGGRVAQDFHETRERHEGEFRQQDKANRKTAAAGLTVAVTPSAEGR